MDVLAFAARALVVSLAISSTITPMIVLASPVVQLEEQPYLAGKDRYTQLSAADPVHVRKGQFIELPLRPGHPEEGSFDLFYRTPVRLDPSKPSVLFFNGGPGGTSDDMTFETTLPDFNFIYFDQRGTGYSHLRTLADEMKPTNFSSELIAQDAESLLQFLAVKQVSVYGHSYGTEVATIFAHLYPQSVRAVLLSGVIYNGEPSLWNPPYRLKLMQAFYDGLDDHMKTRINDLNGTGKLSPLWLSHIIRQSMYQSGFATVLKSQLLPLLALPDDQAIAALQPQSNDDGLYVDSTFMSGIMLLQIACPELSFADPESDWDAALINGKFVPQNDSKRAQACLEVSKDTPRRTYHADQYPISAPVTYIEGTTDGATAPPSAVLHFKNVPQSRAQMIFIKGDGHVSVTGCLGVGADENPDACLQNSETGKIVTKALNGEMISNADLITLGLKDWKRVTQFRPRIPQ